MTGRAVALLVLLSGIVAPATVAAQASPARRIVVEVSTDSAHAPIRQAEVTIFSAGGSVLNRGMTDENGKSSFRLAATTTALDVGVRKLGFEAQRRSLTGITTDTTIVVVLSSATPVLDAVTVTGTALASKQYYVGAADIGRSTRGIFDALDVLKKLRPQMMGDGYRLCSKPDKIWINGRRVYFGLSAPAGVTSGVRGGVLSATRGYQVLDTVLASVKAEHVLDIRYNNCWDKPLAGLQQDALYLTLKPGIDWDWKHGSFPVDTTAMRR